MHYPGGTGAAKPLIGHRKTVLGTKTDPNKSFQKNTKPSSTDVARTNAMYATEANQKRDVGKDCRSGVRLTRTYTVPAALTSTLTVTDAPIDITGTPIISSGPADGQAEATMTGGAAATSGLAAQPLTSCRLVQTTDTGTIAPGPQTYCTCGDVMAGIKTQTSGTLFYSICAGEPFPTIATNPVGAGG